MKFDIIDLTEEEIQKLPVAKMKLLRAAQEKKDELKRKAEQDFKKFREKVLGGGMKNSTLLEDKKAALDEEVNHKCAVLADNLIYNMGVNSLNGVGGNYGPGYLVDYSLSYSDRYIIVRAYYLAITDREERMRRYGADEVAKDYLGEYYTPLYNVLATIDR